MALKRISVDAECKDGYTCPAVWVNDDTDKQSPVIDADQVLVVGKVVDSSPVPLAPGEIAVLVPRQVIRDAAV